MLEVTTAYHQAASIDDATEHIIAGESEIVASVQYISAAQRQFEEARKRAGQMFLMLNAQREKSAAELADLRDAHASNLRRLGLKLHRRPLKKIRSIRRAHRYAPICRAVNNQCNLRAEHAAAMERETALSVEPSVEVCEKRFEFAVAESARRAERDQAEASFKAELEATENYI